MGRGMRNFVVLGKKVKNLLSIEAVSCVERKGDGF